MAATRKARSTQSGGKATKASRPAAVRRVVLRAPVAADRTAWCALVRESRAFFAGLITTQATPAAFDAYLARNASTTAICRLICHRDDGRLLGAINVSEIVRGNFWSGYVGYYIGRDHAGQGYMTEALQLMLRIAFRDAELHRVEANIQPGNAPSIALVRRAGFTREGRSRRYLKVANRWRDHERWALLAEDWTPLARARAKRARGR